jgi:cobalt-zinc-cadmium efflux system membrane fusion protein
VPDVTVSLGAKRVPSSEGDRGGGRRNQVVVGLSVPLPIFDTNRGNVAEALSREEKARDDLAAAELQLGADVAQATERLRSARATAQTLQRDALPGAETAYKAATKGFELGKFSFLEALDAQRTLFQVRAQYLLALADAHRAAGELDRLLGPPTATTFAARPRRPSRADRTTLTHHERTRTQSLAERVGKKQWIAIAVVLALGLGAGALILRTSPAKPEAAGHSEAAGHGDGEHHEEGKAHGKEEQGPRPQPRRGRGPRRQGAPRGGKAAEGREAAQGRSQGRSRPQGRGQGRHKEDKEEKIAFTDAQIKAADIVHREAPAPRASRPSLQLPGEIKFNEDRTAHVVPRVAGVVDSVSANLGQEVKRGQVLAVLSSPSLSEQRSALQSAQRRLALARTTHEREKKLWEEKISPQQDYLQAEQAMQEAQIAVANANQKLLALGATPGSAALGRYELRAPFDGMVVEKHISLGESVKEDVNVFTISDLSSVWAEISVAAGNLNLVRIGEPVTIRSSAFDQTASGKVSYVGSLIGAQTRTATARVTLTNPQRIWRPGLFVNVELVASEADAPVTVSAEAMQTVEDKPTVFLRVPGGFVPQHVQTGRSDGGAWRSSAACARRRPCGQRQLRREVAAGQELGHAHALRTPHVRTHHRFFHRAALARAAGRARHGRAGRLQLPEAAHRRRARHHQRAGADQHRHARLLPAGDRAARDLPDRDRHGRPARPAADALALALRPLAGDGDLQGRHRHLLRAAARERAHPVGAREHAAAASRR